MDELFIILNKFLSKTKLTLLKFYNKLSFLFNKQLTLKEIYKPLSENKLKTNEELSVKLAKLRKSNINLIRNNEQLITENMMLNNKIATMQEMLLKK